MEPMKRSGRTQTCDRSEARRCLTHARQFLQVAELAAEDQREDGSLEYANAAATLAVLAGIPAADAICCSRLGCRSRADDHDQAAQLVLQVGRVGKDYSIPTRLLSHAADYASRSRLCLGPDAG